MDGQEKYVCDADALINLHLHFGRACIRKLIQLAKSETLYIPEGVVRELRRGTDSLSRFAKQQGDLVVVSLKNDLKLLSEITRMEKAYGQYITIGNRTYPGFWKSRAGRKAADSQVVAVARVFGYTVVSDDNAVKLACALENVPCIGWTEFARRLGLMKPQQLSLL